MFWFFSSPPIERERGYKDSSLEQPFASGRRSQIWGGPVLSWVIGVLFAMPSFLPQMVEAHSRHTLLSHCLVQITHLWTQEDLCMGKQPRILAFTGAVERAEVQRWPTWGWLWWMDKQSHKSGTLWNLPIFKCFRSSFLYCAGQMKHICGPNSVLGLPVCSLWWMGSFICFQAKLFHPLPKGFISTIA